MAGRIAIDGETLTLEQVEAISDGASCRLTPAARKRVRASRRVVDRAIAGGKQVYGINTGFGHLASVPIDADRLDRLQLNLIRSHAAGVGEPLPDREVRAILALRANCLCRGHSGLRLEVLEGLVTMLEHRLHPIVPRRGSVGASGDLAPLAHVALALIGEGEVRVDGKRRKAASAWKKIGVEPARLIAKEGLALINGTQVMSAIGILALLRAERLCRVADIVGAMTVDALFGTPRAFDLRIHRARPHAGQLAAATHLRALLADSPIRESHRDCAKVQDPYTLRCMPQVHGAVRDALGYVRATLQTEVNSSTDNPMVFVDDDQLLSGGNFHGQPVSLSLDHLGTASCSLGTISERRIERLLNPELSGLAPFLATDAGLDSGFMIAHVAASALVSENKVLAHPASVDTIPTSAAQEDHVSMGVTAAIKAANIVDNVTQVLAIELVCAAQALEMRRPLRSSKAVEAAHRALRKVVPKMDGDRVLSDDLARAKALIADGALLRAVERHVAD